ncbi:hypothetical protein [Listeria sp. PSOL-1]|uniref:hypothetical protein n=1 Tax=Listeria sp. PSOL-1 TaxID=1844999 RepID=UPI0013D8A1CF|nr:hypothetical protein [Listeria sp. PSOL-1]
MKKEKVLKVVAPMMIASLVFAPIAPAISASASESENIVSPKRENEAAEMLNSIDVEQVQNQAKQMNIYDSEGNITITDSQLARLMQSQDITVPDELKKAAMQRKSSVTKIVKKSGYTYIYLSAALGKTICVGSLGVAGVLIALTGGVGITVAYTIVSTVVSMGWNYVSNGIWLKFKGAKLVAKGKQ